MADTDDIILWSPDKVSSEALIDFINNGHPHDGIQTEPLQEFMARGRVSDCDCGQIQCICDEARGHKHECPHRMALACAVAICCEHGYDVCPQCTPCTCPPPDTSMNGAERD